MAELLQRIRTQVVTFIQSLDKKMRIWLAVGALFVVAIVAAILFLARPTYVPLATGLEYDEMSKIVAMLDEKNIAHKDEGNAVLVSRNDLTKAKMGMAVDAGISMPDYGWTDVMANTSFTMTNQMREQQIRLATANELAGGIEEYIEGVEKAKVELYIAEKSSFLLDEPSKSSISVILQLENGFVFTEGQVTGLVNFLMNGVENLPKENITIIDQTGQTLNRFSDQTAAFIASTNYEQEKTVEKQIEEKLTKFLGSVYGRDNVEVIVSVKLGFDDYSSTSTVYSPPVEGETSGIARSLAEISEKVSSGSTAEGVPGTDSNGETTDYPTGNDSGSDIESASRTINYELNEVVTVLTKAKGAVEDISISILLNTMVMENEVMTDEHKQEVTNLVTTAAGIETRKVQVSAMPFTDNELGVTVYSSEDELVTPGIPLWLVGLIIGVLAVAVIAFFIFNKSKSNKAKNQEIADMQAKEEAKRQEELEEIRTDVEDKSSPKYQIEKFIDAKPEAVAALLRSWMSET